MLKILFRWIFILLGCLYGQMVLAAPPYLSDSPVVTDYERIWLSFYAAVFSVSGSPNLQAPAVEMDWGFAPDQQVFILAGLGTNFAQGAPNSVGIGDLQTGYIWRFVNETSTRPQLGFNPSFFIPTADEDRGLGVGHFVLKAPLSFQKTLGDWTFSGGGGFIFNSLPYTTNVPYGGGLVQRDFYGKFGLGTEIYTQGTNSVSTGFTLLNVGSYYRFTKNVSLIFSAGSSIAGRQTAQGYLGITWYI